MEQLDNLPSTQIKRDMVEVSHTMDSDGEYYCRVLWRKMFMQGKVADVPDLDGKSLDEADRMLKGKVLQEENLQVRVKAIRKTKVVSNL